MNSQRARLLLQMTMAFLLAVLVPLSIFGTFAYLKTQTAAGYHLPPPEQRFGAGAPIQTNPIKKQIFLPFLLKREPGRL